VPEADPPETAGGAFGTETGVPLEDEGPPPYPVYGPPLSVQVAAASDEPALAGLPPFPADRCCMYSRSAFRSKRVEFVPAMFGVEDPVAGQADAIPGIGAGKWPPSHGMNSTRSRPPSSDPFTAFVSAPPVSTSLAGRRALGHPPAPSGAILPTLARQEQTRHRTQTRALPLATVRASGPLAVFWPDRKHQR